MRHVYICPYNKEVECTKKPRPERCRYCGWNGEENAFRKGCIKSGGLKMKEDGTKGLKLKNRDK